LCAAEDFEKALSTIWRLEAQEAVITNYANFGNCSTANDKRLKPLKFQGPLLHLAKAC
jgi:hypothetical protein